MCDIRVVNESAHDTRRYTPYSAWNSILADNCRPVLYHLLISLQNLCGFQKCCITVINTDVQCLIYSFNVLSLQERMQIECICVQIFIFVVSTSVPENTYRFINWKLIGMFHEWMRSFRQQTLEHLLLWLHLVVRYGNIHTNYSFLILTVCQNVANFGKIER